MQRHVPLAALTLLLILVAGLQYQKNQALEQQLQSLQQTLEQSASPAVVSSHGEGSQSEVLQTASEFSDELRGSVAEQIDSSQSTRDIEQRLAALERRLSAGRQEAQQQADAADQARDLAQTVIAGGLLDEASWQPVAAQVETMTAAENKVFWEKTFAAIESGQLAVADTE